jgi:UDP-glucose 4-epimerase
VQERSPDTRKAKQLLGFEATTSLGEILDKVIPWAAEQIEVGQI